jgi:hypothetical protein
MRTIMIMAAGALVIAGAMQLTKANAEEPIQRTDLVKNDIDVPGHEAVQVRATTSRRVAGRLAEAQPAMRVPAGFSAAFRASI